MGNCSLYMGLMHHFPTKHITKHNPSCHGRKGYTWAVLHEKVPSGLSCCHTKRRTVARPSFGMTPTFQKKKSKKSDQCHTKRRVGAATRAHPSFGLTTQAIKDLFA